MGRYAFAEDYLRRDEETFLVENSNLGEEESYASAIDAGTSYVGTKLK